MPLRAPRSSMDIILAMIIIYLSLERLLSCTFPSNNSQITRSCNFNLVSGLNSFVFPSMDIKIEYIIIKKMDKVFTNFYL